MSNHDDGTARPPADVRRKLIVAGAAGLAVLAGGGAYLVASRDNSAETRDTSAVAPFTAPSADTEPTGAVSPAAASSVPSSPTTTVAATTSPNSKPAPKRTDAASVRKQIETAREKAASEGYPLQRPLTEPPMRIQHNGSLAEQTETLPDGGTMRVISAKYDLSSQREMLWAADSGELVDGSRCTQNFRFAQNAKPAVRPTMLLCWQNSAERSVVVLSIGKNGAPSKKAAAAAIGREWDKLR